VQQPLKMEVGVVKMMHAIMLMRSFISGGLIVEKRGDNILPIRTAEKTNIELNRNSQNGCSFFECSYSIYGQSDVPLPLIYCSSPFSKAVALTFLNVLALYLLFLT
jgi:hypothetical protein